MQLREIDWVILTWVSSLILVIKTRIRWNLAQLHALPEV